MSFPKYPEYKDSGVGWLEVVPQSWDVVPLKHIADFINGCPFKPVEWSESGAPIIRIENLNGGESFNCFEGDVDPRYHVARGDLLFGWSGNRGTSFGPFLWDKPGCYYLNQHIFRVTHSQHQRKWFYWCLKAVTAHVEDQAHGIIGMVHVTKGDLGAIKVPIPLLTEQSAISAFLDRETAKIDALVAEQEKLIELLKEKRQAVISHAVTKGLDPNAPMKDSGVEWLGEVPEHWDLMPLKRDLRFLTSGSRGWAEYYSDEGALFIRIGNLTRDSISLDLSDIQRVSVPDGSEGERTKIQAGDLLFSITAFLGSVAVAPENIETSFVSQHVALARLHQEKLSPYWAAYVTLSHIGKTYLESQGYGGTKIQLSLDDVANLILTVPPIEEQNIITEFIKNEVRNIDSLLRETQRAIDLLKERRSALISAAVTGKIDVRNYISEIQEAV